jgi:hypothetical protein
MQVTVEACSSICMNTLQRQVKKIVDKDYPNATPQEVYDNVVKELKNFSVNNQTFDYFAHVNYLGGHRWFFLCPKCKNQAIKLFLPPETAPDREHLYLCKACHKLKNQSALMGQNNMYRKVTRPLRRLKEIEDKIARGHIKAEIVQKLLDEYESLEKHLKEAPEFRLYSFKKKHNL